MTWTGTTRKKHQTSTRQPFFSAPKAFGVNNRHHNPVLFWTAVIRNSIDSSLPDWSPTGEWITFHDDSGWNLVSPDGKTIKALGKIETQSLAFSKDGRFLYGIREEVDKTSLFSLDVSTLKVRDIRELGRDLAGMTEPNPLIRFSVSPDGKSMVYTTVLWKSNLWILEGFRQPGPLSRLGLNWSSN